MKADIEHIIAQKDRLKLEKILLVMFPYWTPLIPPQGISYLKHYLQQYGYVVRTRDVNTEGQFKELYDKYFAILENIIPSHKRGNFYNIGHDVMRNHMMAHIHFIHLEEYIQLVKVIIYKTFFTELVDQQVMELKGVWDTFFDRVEKYMLGLLEKESPAVLGISVLRDTIAPSLYAFRLTRQKYPHIMTVMGGSVFSDTLMKGTPNFDFFLEKTPYIDKIVIGEGQKLFLKVLKRQIPESQRVVTLADIDGETLGFDSTNIPDFSDFNILRNYPYQAAQASKSCPYQCSFCNVPPFYGKYKAKNPQQTVEEMQQLYKKYGTQLFFMNDALLNHIIADLSKEFIETDISLYWDGYLRVDDSACDIENTIFWRRGGFYRARLGVESGSQHVLDLMDKKITIQQTQKTLASLANAGIKTTTYWVIGHPGETEEDFQHTLQLLETVKNYIYEAECNPFIHGYAGQGNTHSWRDKQRLLYPTDAKNMLILQTWIVDGEPSREETYQRVCRFVGHCTKLGIPNPYSLHDILKADERWHKLHKNAVPNLIDFRQKDVYIDENKRVKLLHSLQDTMQEDGDFEF